jgi:hypothetical protein
MLRDIVAETLSTEGDMEVVDEVLDDDSLTCSLEHSDVVIVGTDDPSLAARLLEEHPHLKVLAVRGHGRESLLYQLRPQRVSLGEISPQKLIDEIRKATRA